MRFYCIPVYDFVLLNIRVSRRSTAVDKRRFQVRLFSASTYVHCARTRCACSHFFSRSPLCCVRFCCISVYDYVLLTIRFSRRLTAVDKRSFKVRLFSVSRLDSPAWVGAGLPALARCSHTPGRKPGAQTHALARDTQKNIAPCHGCWGRMTL